MTATKPSSSPIAAWGGVSSLILFFLSLLAVCSIFISVATNEQKLKSRLTTNKDKEDTSSSTLIDAVVRDAVELSESDGVSLNDVVVSVRFFGESLCPFCRKFVTEAWQPVWLDEGLRSAIDYDFIPWGNSYWLTKACRHDDDGNDDNGIKLKYDSKDRACWYKQCIEKKKNNNKDGDDDDDCFSGTPIYQHSTKEGIVDIYESCVKEESGLDNAVSFTYCAEGSIMDNEDLDAEHIMRVCSVSLDGVDSDKIQDCMEQRGRDIEVENAKQTPEHPGVPFVVVDGQPIADPMDVKTEICKSLKSKGATNIPDSCTASSTTSSRRALRDRFHSSRE
mmetsp:Transcript_32283/g.78760  ORF Transcript_32283/g.78760 Transcript_32283/m.78760 type:complete len:335 (+) Transcript_32283:54-1058(+)